MGLEEDIKKQISQKKRDIRLDKFVNYALFNKHGYYFRKKPIGKKNDFITAPEISQMFGEIIGLYLYYIWKEKIKSYFNLVELGPGNGTLFKDIERSLIKYNDFASSAKISFIEINNSLVNIQKKQINNNVFKNISWYKKINFGSKKPSIIYSNEFFDCFPVRQFIFKNFWLEKFISLNKKQNLLIYKFKKVNNLKLLNFLSKYKKEKILEISGKKQIF